MKGTFFEALERSQGIPPVQEKPPHFTDLRRLWDRAGRPCWREWRHASKFPVVAINAEILDWCAGQKVSLTMVTTLQSAST